MHGYGIAGWIEEAINDVLRLEEGSPISSCVQQRRTSWVRFAVRVKRSGSNPAGERQHRDYGNRSASKGERYLLVESPEAGPASRAERGEHQNS
jgi:hypothetical protein